MSSMKYRTQEQILKILDTIIFLTDEAFYISRYIKMPIAIKQGVIEVQPSGDCFLFLQSHYFTSQDTLILVLLFDILRSGLSICIAAEAAV